MLGNPQLCKVMNRKTVVYGAYIHKAETVQQVLLLHPNMNRKKFAINIINISTGTGKIMQCINV